MVFVRNLSDKIIENLKNEKLFKEHLLKDIKNGTVFLAIRNNEIHFYYKGGRLFKYTLQGFYSNIKYAFVYSDKKEYIKENDLDKIEHIKDFTQGYEKIKANCAMYHENQESEFVLRLFKNYSYINQNAKDNIILLDIEAAFSHDKQNKDRFDIVLYNKKQGSIRIVEAKLYSNSELHGNKIVRQINRYEKAIKEQKDNIALQYEKYLKILNKLFNVDLPASCKVEDKVGLLYFDFENPHKKSTSFKELNESLKEALPDNIIYPVGDTANATLKKFFMS